MADFLDEKRREIDARLKELRPLVEEYHRLERASAALQGVEPAASGAGRSGRTSRRDGARPAAGGGQARRGRPKGSGTRGNEALRLVTEQPGITIPELAERMGIKQNYLYRVLPGLAQDGLVEKRGRGWHPKEAA